MGGDDEMKQNNTARLLFNIYQYHGDIFERILFLSAKIEAYGGMGEAEREKLESIAN